MFFVCGSYPLPLFKMTHYKIEDFHLYVESVLELPLNINQVIRPKVGDLVVTKLTHELEYFYPIAMTDNTWSKF